ncbi:phosphatase PAP2 family protein [Streptomyces naganishii]|uniref:Phosphatase PAP2 family protein n=1 Tax=Streptomyces naganishii JCM 4654 TaxID=1306179 RepID=A0A918Y420_9ACTN|nr:phosphatase PAP2 family protein [Streptomyces naganishii]GHD88494.1 phosphatase PAP2 family protein [Streptomyces naganishii JCM 4654]
MILALSGASIDGSLYTGVVGLARRSPAWLDDSVTAWSAYGLAVFAVLMAVGWWRARRVGAEAAVTALAAPFVVVAAYAVNSLVKLLVHEVRPCRTLHTVTLEACPGRTDWSFPSNHAAIAAAAAVALFFVSRRLGVIAAVAAAAMAVSRVWVGAHYPHDVLAGVLTGGLVAFALMKWLARRHGALARRITATRLRPLLVS